MFILRYIVPARTPVSTGLSAVLHPCGDTNVLGRWSHKPLVDVVSSPHRKQSIHTVQYHIRRRIRETKQRLGLKDYSGQFKKPNPYKSANPLISQHDAYKAHRETHRGSVLARVRIRAHRSRRQRERKKKYDLELITLSKDAIDRSSFMLRGGVLLCPRRLISVSKNLCPCGAPFVFDKQGYEEHLRIFKRCKRNPCDTCTRYLTPQCHKCFLRECDDRDVQEEMDNMECNHQIRLINRAPVGMTATSSNLRANKQARYRANKARKS